MTDVQQLPPPATSFTTTPLPSRPPDHLSTPSARGIVVLREERDANVRLIRTASGRTRWVHGILHRLPSSFAIPTSTVSNTDEQNKKKKRGGCRNMGNDVSEDCALRKAMLADEDRFPSSPSSVPSTPSSPSSSYSLSSESEHETEDARRERWDANRKTRKAHVFREARRECDEGVEEEEKEEDEWIQGTVASRTGGRHGSGSKKKNRNSRKKGPKLGRGGAGVAIGHGCSSSQTKEEELASSLPACPADIPTSRLLHTGPLHPLPRIGEHGRNRSSDSCSLVDRSGKGVLSAAALAATATANGSIASPLPCAAASSSSSSTEVAAKHKAAGKKRVEWGQVVVRRYFRMPSPHSVPVRGAWPLGLGAEDGQPPSQISVDAYERQRQKELERRWQELPKRLRKTVGCGEGGLESRQYDYKAPEERNPLFGPMEERRRKLTLLQALESMGEEGSGGGKEVSSDSLSSSPCGSPRKTTLAASLYLSRYQAWEEQEEARSRELDELRASRKQIGCSCHHTAKAPEKLSLKKLKEELHRRHLSAPGTDKARLLEMLKEALQKEKLCSGGEGPDACECFIAGVPCHADVCGCCAGKRGKGGGSGGGKSHHDCRNPVGNFLYEEASVRGHRFEYLTAVPVGPRPRSSSI